MNNVGKSWSREELDFVANSFRAGQQLADTAKTCGRTPYALACQLVKAGLMTHEVGETYRANRSSSVNSGPAYSGPNNASNNTDDTILGMINVMIHDGASAMEIYNAHPTQFIKYYEGIRGVFNMIRPPQSSQ